MFGIPAGYFSGVNEEKPFVLEKKQTVWYKTSSQIKRNTELQTISKNKIFMVSLEVILAKADIQLKQKKSKSLYRQSQKPGPCFREQG